jgi:hypothetical protein
MPVEGGLTMGEKETVAAADGDEAARKLTVSGTPGGNPTAGILSAAVSSMGQLAPAGDAGGEAASPLYADPVNAGVMPNI